MAPILRDWAEEQRLPQPERFDNTPLDPTDVGGSITQLLESHRPLPTTYLLALSQNSAEEDCTDNREASLGNMRVEEIRIQGGVGHCCSMNMGSSDSVMSPLTVQDGPLIVVLISMVISILFVVEMYEFWQRRARRKFLQGSHNPAHRYEKR
ncbi:hypothetical protein G7054_g13130 [Neopestalotiopsis clavispora]|nr:hypothetical protein G7054_g13130 [Neopestalotiopsis clavispora]